MRGYSKKERPGAAFKVLPVKAQSGGVAYAVIGPNDHYVEFKGAGARRSANDLALNMNISHLIDQLAKAE